MKFLFWGERKREIQYGVLSPIGVRLNGMRYSGKNTTRRAELTRRQRSADRRQQLARNVMLPSICGFCLRVWTLDYYPRVV